MRSLHLVTEDSARLEEVRLTTEEGWGMYSILEYVLGTWQSISRVSVSSNVCFSKSQGQLGHVSWSVKVKVELSGMPEHRAQPLLNIRLARIYEDHLDCHLYLSQLRLAALWEGKRETDDLFIR